jgi:putative FmdB family regulatory protein
MPTYEYRCEKCKKRFERVEHVAEHEKAKLRCPKCGSVKVERIFSTFFAKTSRKS